MYCVSINFALGHNKERRRKRSINFALGHNKERRRERKRNGKCHCCNNVCILIILDCRLCVYCVSINFALGHNK